MAAVTKGALAVISVAVECDEEALTVRDIVGIILKAHEMDDTVPSGYTLTITAQASGELLH